MTLHLREFLTAATYRREAVDRFLDPSAHNWAQFDPELGYTLRTSSFADGLEGCRTVQTYETGGWRRMIQFADRPCRIHTYGDSFTQGAQVSDGETWQEVLAAHLCEPIRNFGVGGFGVHQAIRRLRRHESSGSEASHLVLTLWGDDHIRSINAWRWLTYCRDWNRPRFDHLFHSNPWDYARLDPTSRELMEVPGQFTRPEDLYRLTDPEFVFEHFGKDPIVRLLADLESPDHMDRDNVVRLAEVAGMKEDLDFSTSEARFRTAWKAYNTYGVAVSMRLLERLREDLEVLGKKLFVVLAYPASTVAEVCQGIPRDQGSYPDWHPIELRNYLGRMGLPYLDLLNAHVADFQTMRLSPDQYTSRYYIGHYSPTGNHFFAHALRERLKDWLDPPPPAYRSLEVEEGSRFSGYLPGEDTPR